MIEYIIGAVADVYSDESVKIDKKSDGTHEITIDVTKDDYVAAMKSVIDAMWEYEENYMGQSERAFIEEQKQIMYDSLEIFDFYAKGSISIKDEFTQSGDISTAFEIKDMLIPGTEDVRLSFGLEMTVKSSSKQASKTEKIEIPENVFEITQ